MIACSCITIVSTLGAVVLLLTMAWCGYLMFKTDDTLFY